MNNAKFIFSGYNFVLELIKLYVFYESNQNLKTVIYVKPHNIVLINLFISKMWFYTYFTIASINDLIKNHFTLVMNFIQKS